MGSTTSIQWAHHTFNPWRGCSKVSPGCDKCYAETLSKRNPRVLGTWGPHGTRVCAIESTWEEPRAWSAAAEAAGERRRVFCASLADVFEDWPGVVASPWGKATLGDLRERLWNLVDETPALDWMVLTKRPENIARMVPRLWVESAAGIGPLWPQNLWPGTSTESPATFRLRVPFLRAVPAMLRFLSIEPLLERIPAEELSLEGIGWVIVGGESGPKARGCDFAWTREIQRECLRQAVPFFHKQSGASPYDTDALKRHADEHNMHGNVETDLIGEPTEKALEELGDLMDAGRVEVTDPKGGEPAEWTEDLRVREIPAHVPR